MKKLSIIIIMLISCIIGCSSEDDPNLPKKGRIMSVPMRKISRVKLVDRDHRRDELYKNYTYFWIVQFRKEHIEGSIPKEAKDLGGGLFQIEVRETELVLFKEIKIAKKIEEKKNKTEIKKSAKDIVKETVEKVIPPENVITYNGTIKKRDRELNINGNTYIITIKTLSGDLVITTKDSTLYEKYKKGDNIKLNINQN